ncbi:putative cyclic nucleotide-gated ion channel 5 [Ranunculus cassubicifolius]
MNKSWYDIEVQKPDGRASSSKSSKSGVRKGSFGIMSFGRSLKFGAAQAVSSEDIKVSEKKIFDPQDKFLQLWNRLFVLSCIIAVSVDPLFYYLPFIHESSCLGIDRKLARITTVLRTIVDCFYIIHMLFQFRTAYISPTSRGFGRGELVTDSARIAKRYLRGLFISDLLSVLPLPQAVVWGFLAGKGGSDVLHTKQALFYIVLFQYAPRFYRIYPLTQELKRTVGVFAESAFAGAAYYLLWYILASHMVGASWYLQSLERNDTCWKKVCDASKLCKTDYLYCGSETHSDWISNGVSQLTQNCSDKSNTKFFNFGIYKEALASGILANKKFLPKYCYCLWWGLKNLSTLGQGLNTSTYTGEVVFSIGLAIGGLILFALLIGNMQTYLASLTIRLEEMRVKKQDSEQWMHHRLLPQDLRDRVRRYDQYKWLETRGVDEESLVSNLPKDIRRDIKRHLCLELVRRVPLFANMDGRLLDAICERLKPSLYTEKTCIVREGDPVDEMLLIIRGRLESMTTDGGRSGFLNESKLKEGDFCGDELLTWALDPRTGTNLPSSTRTVKAETEVEAFALTSEDLKFVASQFRRLHSRQVQHTFRFYSQHWRTWAACFIQAAWRRYLKKKVLEVRRRDEEVLPRASGGSISSSLATTLLVSRFARNALKGVHRLRDGVSARELVKLQKPPEPDFTNVD